MRDILLLLLLILSVISCDSQFDDKINIKVKVVDSKTSEIKENVLVVMEKMKKPILRMWYYDKVGESYTDLNGEVFFKIKKNKNYRFIAKDEKLKHYGYTEYNSINDPIKNTIIIKYKETSINNLVSD
jgi:hypothetical protein